MVHLYWEWISGGSIKIKYTPQTNALALQSGDKVKMYYPKNEQEVVDVLKSWDVFPETQNGIIAKVSESNNWKPKKIKIKS